MLRPPQHPGKRCPQCEMPVTNVQGVDACSDCDWIDRTEQRV